MMDTPLIGSSGSAGFGEIARNFREYLKNEEVSGPTDVYVRHDEPCQQKSLPGTEAGASLSPAKRALAGLICGLSLFGGIAFNSSQALAAPPWKAQEKEMTLPNGDSFQFHGQGEDPFAEQEGKGGNPLFGHIHTYQDSKRLAAEYSRKLYERVLKEGVEDQSKVINFHDKGLEGYDYEYIQVPERLFEESASILPDNQGKIAHLAFQLDGSLDKPVKKQVFDAYRIFLKNAGSDVRFTFAVESQQDIAALKDMIGDLKLEKPERVSIIHTGGNVSLWIRDSMIPARNNDGSPGILLQDRDYWSSDSDKNMARTIASENPALKVKELPFLRVDGGNIVASGERVFIGEESVRETAGLLEFYSRINKSFEKKVIAFYENRSGETLQKVEMNDLLKRRLVPEIFSQVFQKKVFVIGADNSQTAAKESQPTFHIDMAVTALDENTIMVGDPSLALKLMESIPKSDWQKANSSLKDATGRGSEDPLGSLKEAGEKSDGSYQDNFDAVAKELSAKGFRVVRLPFLRQPWVGLPVVTYNNVIMENYVTKNGTPEKRVFLPAYGIERLDDYARKTYEDQGFKVIQVPVSAITGMQGAVHCFTQVLERTPQ